MNSACLLASHELKEGDLNIYVQLQDNYGGLGR